MASRLLGRWMAVELTPKEKGRWAAKMQLGDRPPSQGDKD